MYITWLLYVCFSISEIHKANKHRSLLLKLELHTQFSVSFGSRIPAANINITLLQPAIKKKRCCRDKKKKFREQLSVMWLQSLQHLIAVFDHISKSIFFPKNLFKVVTSIKSPAYFLRVSIWGNPSLVVQLPERIWFPNKSEVWIPVCRY